MNFGKIGYALAFALTACGGGWSSDPGQDPYEDEDQQDITGEGEQRPATNGDPEVELTQIFLEGEEGATIEKSGAETFWQYHCQVTGNNNGCFITLGCPAGQVLRSAEAVCNLEWGDVSIPPWPADNVVTVERESDNWRDGECNWTAFLGISKFQRNGVYFPTPAGASAWAADCREKDNNGGDCAIAGIYSCR